MWIASRYELDRRRKSLTSLQVLLAGLVGLALLTVLVVAVVLRHNQSPLPKAITKQTDFLLFVPGEPWQISATTVAFNAQSKVLTLQATSGTSTITMTEQETPSQFNDIPQYYPTLVGKLQQYDSFGTVNGTVYLTHPTELAGKSEAVLNHNGTLLFATSQPQLSTSQWRHFFKTVSTQQ